jgi:hypothetical protein
MNPAPPLTVGSLADGRTEGPAVAGPSSFSDGSGDSTLVQATTYDQGVSAEPSNAYLTAAVHHSELPILLVIHEENGDWQFLDGGYVNDVDAVVVHVEHVFEEHPDLRLLADLPEGWAAERDAVAGEWRRYPWQPD